MFTFFAAIDDSLIRFVSQFHQHSPIFDRFMAHVITRPTYKLLPIVACFWLLWFSDLDAKRKKLAVIFSAVGVTCAITISRLIQNFGTERSRPLYAENPDFAQLTLVDAKELPIADWSSMPSDHAAISFALSTAIFYGSRPLGILCYVWSVFIVCVPRIYNGFHYPSDIVAGAVIGLLCFGIAYLAKGPCQKAVMLAEKWEENNKPTLYALGFAASYQIVTMFDDIRGPLDGLVQALN